MISLLGDALALATIAHARSKPYGDQPYITHPIAVAGLVASVHGDPELVAAALLHDTVEDTWVTLATLHRYGFPRRVILAVDGVSRRPGEVYADFVIRAASEEDSRLIKLADNTHNLSTLPDGDPRCRRYVRARRELVAANGGVNPWPLDGWDGE